MEYHGDDTPLTFHDTPIFSLLILLVHVIKFNVHDTLITLPLKLALQLLHAWESDASKPFDEVW